MHSCNRDVCKMSRLKTIFNLSIREYRTRKKIPKNPGIQKRFELFKNEEAGKVAGEELDELMDPSYFESDFARLGDMHKMHEREEKMAKDKVKLRIVARKYFKDVPPSFLTFAEKQQIRNLYESDPSAWTPEILSDHYPATPSIIRNVLKAKWDVRSVDKVITYDKEVMKNWEKFRAGSLALDPKLVEHLNKFKNRKIILTDREEIAKMLVKPPFQFPVPKSKLFSSLTEHCQTKEEDSKNISSSENKNPMLISSSKEEVSKEKDLQHFRENMPSSNLIDNYEAAEINNLKSLKRLQDDNSSKLNDGKSLSVTPKIYFNDEQSITKTSKKTKSKQPRWNNDLCTIDEFFKNSVEKMEKNPSVEDQVLIETYKKDVESYNIAANNNKGSSDVEVENKVGTAVDVKRPDQADVQTSNIDEIDKGLDTYIKDRRLLVDKKDDNYPTVIKIPRSKYKEGMTYRVKDCYYDDDGEFLYRVPGLKV
ncbi:uncharacterized protein LOC105701786 [Orussus abietinus]|uniref:uncharacterized protein LOC105701786 n=1 Tax=Orussus abietinus TaxID=222816 RepID=UPI0006266A7D|nr:uncharacterized protein LOC105701786 [Orussus abietinus]